MAAATSEPETAGLTRRADWRAFAVPSALILGLTFLVWWPALTTTFWLDDFVFLRIYGHGGLPSLQEIEDAFLPPANFNYRPLSWPFWRGGYVLFGENAWGYHALNLLMVGLSGVVVRVIARQLKLSSFAAVTAGVIYVTHPLLFGNAFWLSISQDNMANMFTLTAIACALGADQRPWLWAVSWLSFGLALLSKESALVAPFILVAIFAVQWWTSERVITRNLWPVGGLFIMLGAYLLLRELRLGSPFGTDDPNYARSLIGGHWIKNALAYGGWFARPFVHQEIRPGFDGWFPIEDYFTRVGDVLEENPLGITVAVGLWLTFLALALRAAVKREKSVYLVGLAWLGVALLPAMAFTNRQFEWYGSMALPGFALMAAAMLASLPRNVHLAGLALFLVLSVELVYVHAQRDDHWLLRLDVHADRTSNELRRVVPSVPAGKDLVLFWDEPGYNLGFNSIEGHYGPQFLYQDYDLRVFDGSALRCEGGVWVAPEGWYQQVGTVVPERTVAVRLSEKAPAEVVPTEEAFPREMCR